MPRRDTSNPYRPWFQRVCANAYCRQPFKTQERLQLYCDRACKYCANYRDSYHRRRRGVPIKRKYGVASQVKCANVECRRPFLTYWGHQRFCSKSCSNRHYFLARRRGVRYAA